MNTIGRWILAVGIVLGLSGCGRSPAQSQAELGAATEAKEGKAVEKVRGPAVAGLFYPRHENDLTKQVDQYLSAAKTEEIKNLRALISPHAGYPYSGRTAAAAYKQLVGRNYDTVILLGPSHYAAFNGAAVTDAEAYETPLGLVPVSAKATEIGKIKPFVINPPCDVQRPDFWRQSPKQLPAFGEDQADTWEHSLEVQLPFLQRTLKIFSIVPVVFGRVDPQAAAKALLKFIDERTLIVVSTDLSHYHPYETANKLDHNCVQSICDLNYDWMTQQEACGELPILTLIDIAKQKGWKAKLLDYRNSGDTAGDKSRVVGYAAIAFYQPEGKETPMAEKPRQTDQQVYTAEERKFLLELARKTLTEVTSGGKLPVVDKAEVNEKLQQSRACFVTLTKKGNLRGCIGSIFPQGPLYEAVISRTQAAALEDKRFTPVAAAELNDIEIEISVLSIPQSLEFHSPEELLEKLRPNVDGVVLRVGMRGATYLPQVWEQLPQKEVFLNNLAEKAGLSASAWKGEGVSALTYQVEAFKEAEMK